MFITILNESPHETRVGLTPNTLKSLRQLGFSIFCETDAGKLAGFSNNDYLAAGATLFDDRAKVLSQTNILILSHPPELMDELACLPSGALVITEVEVNPENALVKWCGLKKISLIALNSMPRTSRAQTLDSTLPQQNLLGYRAIIEASFYYQGSFSPILTAAGKVNPASLLILGSNVTCLQAIATAKQLGAVVYVIDLGFRAKEQVEDLGAEFIGAPLTDNETRDADLQKLIEPYIVKANVVICNAITLNHEVPMIINEGLIKKMKSGSVIIDLAGNCTLSEQNKVTNQDGIVILNFSDLTPHISSCSSELFSKNMVNMIKYITVSSASILFNPDDGIIKSALITHDGLYRPFIK